MMQRWSLFLLLAIPLLGMAVVLRWRHRRRWAAALGMAGLVVIMAMFGMITSLTGVARTASHDAKLTILVMAVIGAIALAGAWFGMLRGR